MSSALVISFLNLRMVITGPFVDKGGITALIREPSLSLESTIGFVASMVLPIGPIILSMVLIICSSLINETLSSLISCPSISI